MTEKSNYGAYQVLAQYIADEKTDAFDARERIEERGTRIVSSSAAIVALIVGLVTIVLGRNGAILTHGVAIFLLVIALVTFLIAAGCGVYVQNSAQPRKAIALSTLRHLIREHSVWNGTDREARRSCAHLDIEAIASLRSSTRTKAIVCNFALSCQAIAGALLTISLGIEITAR